MDESHAESGWGPRAPTPAQFAELFAQVKSGRMTRGRLQAALRGRRGLGNGQEQMEEWIEFYGSYFFAPELSLSRVKIPVQQPGLDRLIVVVKDLTQNQGYDACARQFPCWRYADDLDKAIPHNDRDPKNGAYAVWVRDRVEADEENKNLSADQLTQQKIASITNLERMLYELKYWDETGEHLDQRCWTLCSGSRYSDGSVPFAYWGGGKFRVNWYNPGSHYGTLRSRSVVS